MSLAGRHGLADIATTVYPPDAAGRRFNMKCLDYSVDETYFTSVQAEAVHRYTPEGGEPPGEHPLASSTEGTLRLCSLSVVFEPKAPHIPMIRLPFKELEGLEEAPESAKARAKADRRSGRKKAGNMIDRLLSGDGVSDSNAQRAELNYTGAQAPHAFHARARGHFEMKPHGHSTPYPLLRAASTLEILLHGPQARTAEALGLLLDLWRVHQLSEEDYAAAQRELTSIIAAVEQRVPKIVTESALPVLELRACRVTPFAAARGRLTLSRSALYFQPLLNSPADTQEIRHPWPTLHYCLPRRYISRSQAATTNFLRGYELYFAR